MSAKPGISLLIQNTNEKDNKCCSNYKHNNLVRDFILVKLEIKDHLCLQVGYSLYMYKSLQHFMTVLPFYQKIYIWQCIIYNFLQLQ